MTAKPVAIVGAGGHGKVVLHALRSVGRRVVCLTDRNPEAFPDGVDGIPVTSDNGLIESHGPDDIDLVLGVGSIGAVGHGHIRRRIVERMTKHGYTFPALVHETAWVAESVALESGVQIHAGAVVQPGTSVGEFAIVNTGATVDHDCRLGVFVHIAPGATLSGDVIVEDGVHIGTGASVIQGVRLGAGSVVAAGAVVVRDVASGECVAGVPARRIELPTQSGKRN